MVLIEIPEIATLAPMSKSKKKLEIVSNLIANKKLTPEKLQLEFTQYLAVVLRERVKDSVQKQTIAGAPMKRLYKPLNPEYRKSKPWGTKGKFWVKTHTLIDTLSVWREGNVVKIGWKRSVTYQDSGVSVADVAMWVENGTDKMPARPLFKPHMAFISKNISQYFKHFVKLKYGYTL